MSSVKIKKHIYRLYGTKDKLNNKRLTPYKKHYGIRLVLKTIKYINKYLHDFLLMKISDLANLMGVSVEEAIAQLERSDDRPFTLNLTEKKQKIASDKGDMQVL